MILRRLHNLNRKLFIQILFFLISSITINAQNTGGGELYPDLNTNTKALEEWQNLKYGMFIHWGPVALRGTEIGWSRGTKVQIEEYDNLYKEFNPLLFSAADWVKTIKDAGMKYLVITSKHHDGFCIWHSEYTDYDIASTPFKRDVLKELSDECKKQGILFGTYHSIADWHHEHYTTRYGGDPRPIEESDMNVYVEYLKHQVKELIEKYDTDILWFDGEWEDAWTHEMGMNLYKFIRDLKDDIIINNRVDKGRQGMKGMTKSSDYAGDFGTPEQEIGAFFPDQPWESCITICNQWAWKPNDRLKSLKECIHTLAQTAGGGGNLLLNVGPMLDGRIEQRQINRLREIGDWLKLNGESIYRTKGGPFKPNSWMSSTNKLNNIYIHIFKWPEQNLILPNLKEAKISNISILSNNEKLSFRITNNETLIALPANREDLDNSVIELTLDSEAEIIEPLEVPKNKFSGLSEASLKLRYPASSKFPSRGLESLRDEIRGSKSYTDINWMGFEGIDFEVNIDLREKKKINEVGIGSLQNQNSWIFLPTSVAVFISDDNINFVPIKEMKNLTKENKYAINNLDITVDLDDISVRYLKIVAENVGTCPEWHKGAGGKAWLFIDEVWIK